MNTALNWKNVKEFMILLIGVFLVFALFSVKTQLSKNARAADGGRSLVCLQLKAQGQPVEAYDPCMRPAVYKLWKDEPTATLTQRLCATGAMTEGCEKEDGR